MAKAPASKFVYGASGLAILGSAIGLAPVTGNASLTLLGGIPPLWFMYKGEGSRTGRSAKKVTEIELRWKALVTPREFHKYHTKLVEAK